MMAVNNSFALQDEELSCPICFEEFSCFQNDEKYPKLLMCLHTFCLKCVQTLMKYDGSLQCSICRSIHKIEEVKELLDNYLVIDHLRKQQLIEDEKLALRLRDEFAASDYQRIQEEQRFEDVPPNSILLDSSFEQTRSNNEVIHCEGESLAASSVPENTSLIHIDSSFDRADELEPYSCIGLDQNCGGVLQESDIFTSANIPQLHYSSEESSSPIERTSSPSQDHDYEDELSQAASSLALSQNSEDEVSTDEDGMETAHSSLNIVVRHSAGSSSDAASASLDIPTSSHVTPSSDVPITESLPLDWDATYRQEDPNVDSESDEYEELSNVSSIVSESDSVKSDSLACPQNDGEPVIFVNSDDENDDVSHEQNDSGTLQLPMDFSSSEEDSSSDHSEMDNHEEVELCTDFSSENENSDDSHRKIKDCHQCSSTVHITVEPNAQIAEDCNMQ